MLLYVSKNLFYQTNIHSLIWSSDSEPSEDIYIYPGTDSVILLTKLEVLFNISANSERIQVVEYEGECDGELLL